MYINLIILVTLVNVVYQFARAIALNHTRPILPRQYSQYGNTQAPPNDPWQGKEFVLKGACHFEIKYKIYMPDEKHKFFSAEYVSALLGFFIVMNQKTFIWTINIDSHPAVQSCFETSMARKSQQKILCVSGHGETASTLIRIEKISIQGSGNGRLKGSCEKRSGFCHGM